MGNSPNDGTREPALPPWMEEARQYARVELWFHALVKKYFKGSLKVRFCLAISVLSPPQHCPSGHVCNVCGGS